MEQTREDIESEIRQDIVRSILSLVIPPNWSSEFTVKYIVGYLTSPKPKVNNDSIS